MVLGVIVILVSVFCGIKVILFSDDNFIKSEYEKLLEEELPYKIKTEELYNSSGGFHNDGIELHSAEFYESDSDCFVKQIENEWDTLPLSKRMNEFIYGVMVNGEMRNYNFKDVVIPNINNGYWTIVNRNENADALNGKSYNFSLFIYDIDKSKLYLLQIDT